MANTVSAKKMTRKIAKRTVINKSRRSRMRTFLRKVEEAIAAGDKGAAAAGSSRRRAGDHARRSEGHRAQEHRFAESLPSRPSHHCDRRVRRSFSRSSRDHSSLFKSPAVVPGFFVRAVRLEGMGKRAPRAMKSSAEHFPQTRLTRGSDRRVMRA